MSIARSIRNNPFIRIVVPIILGIVATRYLSVNEWILWTSLIIAYLFSWYSAGRRFGSAYIFATLVLCAAALSTSNKTIHALPSQQKLYMCLQVTDNPTTEGRWHKTTATVVYYRPLNDSLRQWTRTDQKIYMNVDTCYRIALGEQFACRGYVNRFDGSAGYESFAKLMNARGFVGTLYVTAGNLIQRSPTVTKTPMYYAKSLQRIAVERIGRLNMSDNEHSVATTMVAGEKRGFDKNLREAYSRVGASHLLAVSGLHIGIVFTFLNILLYLLPMFTGGHIARNAIVIVAIWLYAALSGLSPSVVRAAMMFSGAQIALGSSQYRNAMNIMLGTAAVMLCLNPNNLYDISFQLSFAAVFFIILMFGPLYEIFRTGNKLLNLLISVTLVGVIATLGTLPLVSYVFGNVPIIGIVIGPLLILCANFIMWIGVGWIIAPFMFVQGAVSGALEWIIGFQNKLVSDCAALSFSCVEYRMPMGLVIGCYLITGAVAVWLHTRKTKKTFKLDI